jgi:molybdenum cofactor cytidylyltransferase
MKTAAIILAAGGSRRMGSSKQLVDWGGRPLLQHVVDDVATWPVDLIVVVLGNDAEEVLDRVDFGEATVAINPEWEEGMASSLRVGLDILMNDATVERAIVALGDQPRVNPHVVEALLESHSRTRAMATVPKYRYTWGNPVVISKALWPRVMSLTGDVGARKLLQAHPAWVDEVWFEELPPRDIDTRADLEELRPR